MLSARYSPKVYKRIKQAKVAIAGLGDWVQILP